MTYLYFPKQDIFDIYCPYAYHSYYKAPTYYTLFSIVKSTNSYVYYEFRIFSGYKYVLFDVVNNKVAVQDHNHKISFDNFNFISFGYNNKNGENLITLGINLNSYQINSNFVDADLSLVKIKFKEPYIEYPKFNIQKIEYYSLFFEYDIISNGYLNIDSLSDYSFRYSSLNYNYYKFDLENMLLGNQNATEKVICGKYRVVYEDLGNNSSCVNKELPYLSNSLSHSFYFDSLKKDLTIYSISFDTWILLESFTVANDNLIILNFSFGGSISINVNSDATILAKLELESDNVIENNTYNEYLGSCFTLETKTWVYLGVSIHENILTPYVNLADSEASNSTYNDSTYFSVTIASGSLNKGIPYFSSTIIPDYNEAKSQSNSIKKILKSTDAISYNLVSGNDGLFIRTLRVFNEGIAPNTASWKLKIFSNLNSLENETLLFNYDFINSKYTYDSLFNSQIIYINESSHININYPSVILKSEIPQHSPPIIDHLALCEKNTFKFSLFTPCIESKTYFNTQNNIYLNTKLDTYIDIYPKLLDQVSVFMWIKYKESSSFEENTNSIFNLFQGVKISLNRNKEFYFNASINDENLVSSQIRKNKWNKVSLLVDLSSSKITLSDTTSLIKHNASINADNDNPNSYISYFDQESALKINFPGLNHGSFYSYKKFYIFNQYLNPSTYDIDNMIHISQFSRSVIFSSVILRSFYEKIDGLTFSHLDIIQSIYDVCSVKNNNYNCPDNMLLNDETSTNKFRNNLTQVFELNEEEDNTQHQLFDFRFKKEIDENYLYIENEANDFEEDRNFGIFKNPEINNNGKCIYPLESNYNNLNALIFQSNSELQLLKDSTTNHYSGYNWRLRFWIKLDTSNNIYDYDLVSNINSSLIIFNIKIIEDNEEHVLVVNGYSSVINGLTELLRINLTYTDLNNERNSYNLYDKWILITVISAYEPYSAVFIYSIEYGYIGKFNVNKIELLFKQNRTDNKYYRSTSNNIYNSYSSDKVLDYSNYNFISDTPDSTTYNDNIKSTIRNLNLNEGIYLKINDKSTIAIGDISNSVTSDKIFSLYMISIDTETVNIKNIFIENLSEEYMSRKFPYNRNYYIFHYDFSNTVINESDIVFRNLGFYASMQKSYFNSYNNIDQIETFEDTHYYIYLGYPYSCNTNKTNISVSKLISDKSYCVSASGLIMTKERGVVNINSNLNFKAIQNFNKETTILKEFKIEPKVSNENVEENENTDNNTNDNTDGNTDTNEDNIGNNNEQNNTDDNTDDNDSTEEPRFIKRSVHDKKGTLNNYSMVVSLKFNSNPKQITDYLHIISFLNKEIILEMSGSKSSSDNSILKCVLQRDELNNIAFSMNIELQTNSLLQWLNIIFISQKEINKQYILNILDKKKVLNIDINNNNSNYNNIFNYDSKTSTQQPVYVDDNILTESQIKTIKIGIDKNSTNPDKSISYTLSAIRFFSSAIPIESILDISRFSYSLPTKDLILYYDFFNNKFFDINKDNKNELFYYDMISTNTIKANIHDIFTPNFSYYSLKQNTGLSLNIPLFTPDADFPIDYATSISATEVSENSNKSNVSNFNVSKSNDFVNEFTLETIIYSNSDFSYSTYSFASGLLNDMRLFIEFSNTKVNIYYRNSVGNSLLISKALQKPFINYSFISLNFAYSTILNQIEILYNFYYTYDNNIKGNKTIEDAYILKLNNITPPLVPINALTNWDTSCYFICNFIIFKVHKGYKTSSMLFNNAYSKENYFNDSKLFWNYNFESASIVNYSELTNYNNSYKNNSQSSGTIPDEVKDFKTYFLSSGPINSNSNNTFQLYNKYNYNKINTSSSDYVDYSYLKNINIADYNVKAYYNCNSYRKRLYSANYPDIYLSTSYNCINQINSDRFDSPCNYYYKRNTQNGVCLFNSSKDHLLIRKINNKDLSLPVLEESSFSLMTWIYIPALIDYKDLTKNEIGIQTKYLLRYYSSTNTRNYYDIYIEYKLTQKDNTEDFASIVEYVKFIAQVNTTYIKNNNDLSITLTKDVSNSWVYVAVINNDLKINYFIFNTIVVNKKIESSTEEILNLSNLIINYSPNSSGSKNPLLFPYYKELAIYDDALDYNYIINKRFYKKNTVDYSFDYLDSLLLSIEFNEVNGENISIYSYREGDFYYLGDPPEIRNYNDLLNSHSFNYIEKNMFYSKRPLVICENGFHYNELTNSCFDINKTQNRNNFGLSFKYIPTNPITISNINLVNTSNLYIRFYIKQLKQYNPNASDDQYKTVLSLNCFSSETIEKEKINLKTNETITQKNPKYTNSLTFNHYFLTSTTYEYDFTINAVSYNRESNITNKTRTNKVNNYSVYSWNSIVLFKSRNLMFINNKLKDKMLLILKNYSSYNIEGTETNNGKYYEENLYESQDLYDWSLYPSCDISFLSESTYFNNKNNSVSEDANYNETSIYYSYRNVEIGNLLGENFSYYKSLFMNNKDMSFSVFKPLYYFSLNNIIDNVKVVNEISPKEDYYIHYLSIDYLNRYNNSNNSNNNSINSSYSENDNIRRSVNEPQIQALDEDSFKNEVNNDFNINELSVSNFDSLCDIENSSSRAVKTKFDDSNCYNYRELSISSSTYTNGYSLKIPNTDYQYSTSITFETYMKTNKATRIVGIAGTLNKIQKEISIASFSVFNLLFIGQKLRINRYSEESWIEGDDSRNDVKEGEWQHVGFIMFQYDNDNAVLSSFLNQEITQNFIDFNSNWIIKDEVLLLNNNSTSGSPITMNFAYVRLWKSAFSMSKLNYYRSQSFLFSNKSELFFYYDFRYFIHNGLPSNSDYKFFDSVSGLLDSDNNDNYENLNYNSFTDFKDFISYSSEYYFTDISQKLEKNVCDKNKKYNYDNELYHKCVESNRSSLIFEQDSYLKLYTPLDSTKLEFSSFTIDMWIKFSFKDFGNIEKNITNDLGLSGQANILRTTKYDNSGLFIKINYNKPSQEVNNNLESIMEIEAVANYAIGQNNNEIKSNKKQLIDDHWTYINYSIDTNLLKKIFIYNDEVVEESITDPTTPIRVRNFILMDGDDLPEENDYLLNEDNNTAKLRTLIKQFYIKSFRFFTQSFYLNKLLDFKYTRLDGLYFDRLYYNYYFDNAHWEIDDNAKKTILTDRITNSSYDIIKFTNCKNKFFDEIDENANYYTDDKCSSISYVSNYVMVFYNIMLPVKNVMSNEIIDGYTGIKIYKKNTLFHKQSINDFRLRHINEDTNLIENIYDHQTIDISKNTFNEYVTSNIINKKYQKINLENEFIGVAFSGKDEDIQSYYKNSDYYANKIDDSLNIYSTVNTEDPLAYFISKEYFNPEENHYGDLDFTKDNYKNSNLFCDLGEEIMHYKRNYLSNSRDINRNTNCSNNERTNISNYENLYTNNSEFPYKSCYSDTTDTEIFGTSLNNISFDYTSDQTQTIELWFLPLYLSTDNYIQIFNIKSKRHNSRLYSVYITNNKIKLVIHNINNIANVNNKIEYEFDMTKVDFELLKDNFSELFEEGSESVNTTNDDTTSFFKLNKWNYLCLRINYNSNIFIVANHIKFSEESLDEMSLLTLINTRMSIANPFAKQMQFLDSLEINTKQLSFVAYPALYKNIKVYSDALNFSDLNKKKFSYPLVYYKNKIPVNVLFLPLKGSQYPIIKDYSFSNSSFDFTNEEQNINNEHTFSAEYSDLLNLNSNGSIDASTSKKIISIPVTKVYYTNKLIRFCDQDVNLDLKTNSCNRLTKDSFAMKVSINAGEVQIPIKRFGLNYITTSWFFSFWIKLDFEVKVANDYIIFGQYLSETNEYCFSKKHSRNYTYNKYDDTGKSEFKESTTSQSALFVKYKALEGLVQLIYQYNNTSEIILFSKQINLFLETNYLLFAFDNGSLKVYVNLVEVTDRNHYYNISVEKESKTYPIIPAFNNNCSFLIGKTLGKDLETINEDLEKDVIFIDYISISSLPFDENYFPYIFKNEMSRQSTFLSNFATFFSMDYRYIYMSEMAYLPESENLIPLDSRKYIKEKKIRDFNVQSYANEFLCPALSQNDMNFSYSKSCIKYNTLKLRLSNEGVNLNLNNKLENEFTIDLAFKLTSPVDSYIMILGDYNIDHPELNDPNDFYLLFKSLNHNGVDSVEITYQIIYSKVFKVQFNVWNILTVRSTINNFNSIRSTVSMLNLENGFTDYATSNLPFNSISNKMRLAIANKSTDVNSLTSSIIYQYIRFWNIPLTDGDLYLKNYQHIPFYSYDALNTFYDFRFHSNYQAESFVEYTSNSTITLSSINEIYQTNNPLNEFNQGLATFGTSPDVFVCGDKQLYSLTINEDIKTHSCLDNKSLYFPDFTKNVPLSFPSDLKTSKIKELTVELWFSIKCSFGFNTKVNIVSNGIEGIEFENGLELSINNENKMIFKINQEPISVTNSFTHDTNNVSYETWNYYAFSLYENGDYGFSILNNKDSLNSVVEYHDKFDHLNLNYDFSDTTNSFINLGISNSSCMVMYLKMFRFWVKARSINQLLETQYLKLNGNYYRFMYYNMYFDSEGDYLVNDVKQVSSENTYSNADISFTNNSLNYYMIQLSKLRSYSPSWKTIEDIEGNNIELTLCPEYSSKNLINKSGLGSIITKHHPIEFIKCKPHNINNKILGTHINRLSYILNSSISWIQGQLQFEFWGYNQKTYNSTTVDEPKNKLFIIERLKANSKISDSLYSVVINDKEIIISLLNKSYTFLFNSGFSNLNVWVFYAISISLSNRTIKLKYTDIEEYKDSLTFSGLSNSENNLLTDIDETDNIFITFNNNSTISSLPFYFKNFKVYSLLRSFSTSLQESQNYANHSIETFIASQNTSTPITLKIDPLIFYLPMKYNGIVLDNSIYDNKVTSREISDSSDDKYYLLNEFHDEYLNSGIYQGLVDNLTSNNKKLFICQGEYIFNGNKCVAKNEDDFYISFLPNNLISPTISLPIDREIGDYYYLSTWFILPCIFCQKIDSVNVVLFENQCTNFKITIKTYSSLSFQNQKDVNFPFNTWTQFIFIKNASSQKLTLEIT